MKKRLEDLKLYLRVVVLVLFITTIILIDISDTQKAVKTCVASGQNIEICRELER